MKLTSLKVRNVLGVKHADINFATPITIVLGANGHGKSSLAECVRLALQGDSPRVNLRKDYGALVHAGAKYGQIELHAKGVEPYVVQISASGKVEDTHKGEDAPEALQYVLDPPLFASVDPNKRREFLFRLCGVELGPEQITKRLLARDCDVAKVEAIAPILRAGHEAAAKHAATKTSESRGAWKAITGENYGDRKAVSWRAPVPEFSEADAAQLTTLDHRIAGAEIELAAATKRLGVAEHEAQQRVKRAQTIEHLRAQAKKHAEHSTLVNAAAKEVDRLKAALLEAQQKAGHAPITPATKVRRCPSCGADICEGADGGLAIYVAPAPMHHDPEAAARIPDLQRAVAHQEKVLARHQQAEREADEAGHHLKALEDQAPADKPDDPEIVRQTVDTLRESIAKWRERQGELRKAQAALDAAGEKTKQARRYHQDVQEWSAIADALAPDGIPGELLGEALGPINKRLRQSSDDAQWPCVEIGADMAITMQGRPYQLCSESERWRADAMIAEAIANLSGLRLLVLDRLDVLDPTQLSAALRWLDTLAYEKDVDTVIALGTIEAPEELTDLMQLVRIERGEVAPAEKEAVAA